MRFLWTSGPPRPRSRSSTSRITINRLVYQTLYSDLNGKPGVCTRSNIGRGPKIKHDFGAGETIFSRVDGPGCNWKIKNYLPSAHCRVSVVNDEKRWTEFINVPRSRRSGVYAHRTLITLEFNKDKISPNERRRPRVKRAKIGNR